MKNQTVRGALRAGAGIAGIALGLRGMAWLAQRRLNGGMAEPPYRASDETRQLHNRLLVADLHADPLLWRRDLLRRNPIGHMDIPRLREANVALQVFGVVTQAPRPERDATFGSGLDLITLLSVAQWQPPRTWAGLKQRALYQAQKLREAERRSGGRFTVITSSKGLVDFLSRRAKDPQPVAGLLMLEGAQAFEGKVENVDVFHEAGFRMVSLTHMSDNEAGGSSLGTERTGLTPVGGEAVTRLQERGMLIDLAHASPALFHDLLWATSRPVLVSHTGVQGVCPNPRNLSDAQIRAVAQHGGVIGIGFDALFTCEPGVRGIAYSIRYVARLVGVEHVALGSDFDGTIRPPFDVSGLPLLTEELVKQGFGENEIAMVMGGNAIRFLLENLP